MRAIPSPTCRTVPTSARSVSTSYCSIRCFRIDVISSGRSFTVVLAPHELVSKSFKPSFDAGVQPVRAGVEDDAADQFGVDAPRRLHLPPCRLFDLADDRVRFRVAQLPRGRQVDGQTPFVLRDQALELTRELLELAGAALVRDHEQEVSEKGFVLAREIGE